MLPEHHECDSERSQTGRPRGGPKERVQLWIAPASNLGFSSPFGRAGLGTGDDDQDEVDFRLEQCQVREEGLGHVRDFQDRLFEKFTSMASGPGKIKSLLLLKLNKHDVACLLTGLSQKTGLLYRRCR